MENAADSGVEMSGSGPILDTEVKKSNENVKKEEEIQQETHSCQKTPEQNERQIDHSIFNTISKIVNPAAKNLNSKMDLQDIPAIPQTDEDYEDCCWAFSKAVKEKNEELINLILSKKEILRRHFGYQKTTLLHIIAERGTVEIAAKMCELGLNINARDRNGETPIFHAIRHSTDMVKILLNYGAALNIKCNRHVSPLQEALFSGSEKIVEMLLNKIFADKQSKEKICPNTVQNSEEIVRALLFHKYDLHLEAKNYPLLIFFAACIGNKELFKLTTDDCRKYLESVKDRKQGDQPEEEDSEEENDTQPPQELNFQGYFKRTALHYAVKKQLPEVIRFLLKAGADVNCRTQYGYTPLHYAACLENEEICKILLSFGAELNSAFRASPLYLVCGRSEARNLLDSGDGYYYEEFHNYFRNRMDSYYEPEATFNLGIMKLFLQNKADPEIADDDQMTPLLEACRAGRLDVLNLLLQFKANVHALDEERNSALHYASYSNNIEVVNLLLDKGLDIEIKNANDYTPFLFAVQNERQTCLEMIEYLADLGANINVKNYQGATALHIASYFDWLEVAECLLTLGVDYKLKFNSEDLPAMGRVLSSMYFFGLGSGREAITAFIALKEETLGDYIASYIRNDDDEINQADDFFKKSKLELERLKSTKIAESVRHSFHDFLTSNIYSATNIIKNKEVRTVFTGNKYKTDFPCYKGLLDRRFHRVVTLEKTVDETVAFFQKYGKVNLPILVVDKILSFFHPKDFRNFGRILSGRRC